MLKNQKGITLIALIITIIVMLILVGVTINVALNGGLFSKAEEATTKTKIAQVQEALTIKKAEVLADSNGVVEEYNITMKDLSLPTELKTEYGNKLKISKAGILGYDASVVTDVEEQNIFKSMGIEEYKEEGETYTFTIGDLVSRGLLGADGQVQTTVDEFFPDTVSDELKNSTFRKVFSGTTVQAYNIICLDSNYTNIFDVEDPSGPPNAYMMLALDGNIMFGITDAAGEPVTSENYENYANITFKISMAPKVEITGKAYGDETEMYILLSNGILVYCQNGNKVLENPYTYVSSFNQISNWQGATIRNYVNATKFIDFGGLPLALSEDEETLYTCFMDITVTPKVIEIGGENGGESYSLNTSVDISKYISE